jgi:hypothetical protein
MIIGKKYLKDFLSNLKLIGILLFLFNEFLFLFNFF